MPCVHQPAVDVVYDGVDDVSEDERPGSSQAVLHLSEQQVDKQVIHEQDAMALVAVGRLCCPLTNSQQNPVDRNLQRKNQNVKQKAYRATKIVTMRMMRMGILLEFLTEWTPTTCGLHCDSC